MKKSLILLTIFITCGSLTAYNLRYQSQKNNEVNKEIIKEEEKEIIKTTKKNKKWSLFIAIIEIIGSLLIFYLINLIFTTYDKKTTSVTTDSYKENISLKFSYLMKDTFKEPIKYISYQDQCTPSIVFKSGLLNILNLSFYWLLLSFFNGFKKNFETTKKTIKKSFRDVVYDYAIDEYYDIFYGLYQNYNLEYFYKINRSVNDLCENLKKNNISASEINDIKNILSVEIVERKKNKNNYISLVGLTCLSAYLYVNDEKSLKNYLKMTVRFKFSLIDIFRKIQKHQKISVIKKKMAIYSKYSSDFKNIENAINNANNMTILQLISMVFIRGCFADSDNFLYFLKELIIESIFYIISSFTGGAISDVTNIISDFAGDSNVTSLLSSVLK